MPKHLGERRIMSLFKFAIIIEYYTKFHCIDDKYFIILDRVLICLFYFYFIKILLHFYFLFVCVCARACVHVGM